MYALFCALAFFECKSQRKRWENREEKCDVRDALIREKSVKSSDGARYTKAQSAATEQNHEADA